MKMVEIQIDKTAYPLCFSLRAVTEFCERYGTLDGCFARIKELSGANNTPELIQEYMWQLSIMLDAGYRIACKDDKEAVKPPETDEFLDAFGISDLSYIQRKVIEAIGIGSQREVGAAAAKNGDGAAAQAPEN